MKNTRRSFLRTTAVGSAGVLIGTTTMSGTIPQEVEKEDTLKMAPIKHLILFVHPPMTYSVRKMITPAPEISANCRKVMASQANDITKAVCIIPSEDDKDLFESAQKKFGNRCVINPNDSSDATHVILSLDMNRAFNYRGSHGEWNIYELWSSNTARCVVEGLKKELGKRGFSIVPEELTVETFGSWSGCHHKYTNLVTTYLGARYPANRHSEKNLCTLKNLPMDVDEFIECIPLAQHVMMYLFRRADGCPMAQFWDGLRPFWEPLHTATVVINPAKVTLFSFSPNTYIPVNSIARKLKDSLIVDVGDGCHPAFSTIVGNSNKDTDFEAFRIAMSNAVIGQREGNSQSYVNLAVEV